MLEEMFSFEQPDSAHVPDKHSSTMESDNGGVKVTKQTHLCEGKDWGQSGDINALSLDDMYFDSVPPPFHLSNEEIRKVVDIASETIHVIEPEQKNIPGKFSASLKLLTNYASRIKRMRSYEKKCMKLSTDEILRLAGEKFIQSPELNGNELSGLGHPFWSSFSGLSEEDKKDLELVFHLLASAEKVGEKQFDRARKLLDECDKLSSRKGNPVQRLVYYFSAALDEKIDRETGRTTSTMYLRENPLLEMQETLMSPNPSVVAFHQAVPFSQVTQFPGIQALVESVSDARKIHIIDLAIRSGTHFTILMQALAARNECRVKHLKITAVGTKAKPKIDETGSRLTSFAQSLNFHFSFDVIMLEDILDFHESKLSLFSNEVVAIYCPFFLTTMIAEPDRLESLIRVIRTINPRVMIVNEIEGNHNSPVFVNRFIESLFWYGALFDSMEDCMNDDESNRAIQESFYFSKGIRNIVAAEGKDRSIRHVSINVWRAFFARFGMVEMELSALSVFHANLVLNKFSCGSSCTIDRDGKCLIIGWKGTPIHSISVWRFTQHVLGTSG